jgi:pentapeptide repeat protein
MEWFVYRLRSLALFDLLELAGRLVLLFGIVSWVLEAEQRARQAEEAIKARHYRAWELINAARGSTGDGGRRDALQDLKKDGVSLAKAPLEQAYLLGVDLKGADLKRAHLKGAYLDEAHLKGARNLTQEQLDAANGDDRTQLPEGLTRPTHWSRSEGNEEQSGDGTTGQ